MRDDSRGDARADPEAAVRLTPCRRLPRQVPHGRPRHDRARARADLDRGDGLDADRRHDAARDPRPRALDASRRSRLAPRRVRRRDEGRGRREGSRADARSRARRPAAVRHEALRRPELRAAHLGGARSGARRDRVRAGQGRHARRLGGLGRPARAARRIPQAALDARRQVRLRELALRPLRTGLRPRPLELRPRHQAGDREVPPLARGGERPRDRARRLDLGRARRRPVARGAAPEDVRRPAHRRLRGVQVDLGSRLEDESRQGRQAVPRRREPPPRRRLRAVAADRSSSATRATTATLRTRPSAASASANAARRAAST